MTFLIVLMIAFLVLEGANVAIMFFAPEAKVVHGMGMFPAWQKAKADPDIHNLMRYLTVWVGTSKLIFVALLALILLWGDRQLMSYAGLVMAVAMVPFFIFLYPIMRTIDANDQVVPKGFSVRLASMIAFLIVALVGASLMAL